MTPPPEPPSLDQMPMCERCLREGGIVVHGKRQPPHRADMHPSHTIGIGGNGTKSRPATREPLCARHVEIVSWEASGKPVGYPAPRWTQARRQEDDR